ncbi:hypothetical protein NM688_g1804 [Phlebia brevispora]|uniref:Uncharacterized protein n=1 Tax=Phlebia brevispora TaxID=194682 RepID=A0ACC1TAA8_9APHY|nr:hypothetical protein NM688_g1804 [Phlebia brevispora]
MDTISIKTTASNALQNCRREEIRKLLDCCHDVIEQIARFYEAETEHGVVSDAESGMEAIEDTCKSVGSIARAISERGFLWCLMNASNLDAEFSDCGQLLEKAIATFLAMMQRSRKRSMRIAREHDQQVLSQILASAHDSDDLIGAIRSRECAHRTAGEIVVALRKHIQDHPASDNPEDQFLRSASHVICPSYDVNKSIRFESFVISSVEVHFNIDRPIGWGACGKVYRGKWNDITVAIKRMRASDGHMLSPIQRKAFYHEVKTWSELRHPNILPFYGACMEVEIMLPQRHDQPLLPSQPSDLHKLIDDESAAIDPLTSRCDNAVNITACTGLGSEPRRRISTSFLRNATPAPATQPRYNPPQALSTRHTQPAISSPRERSHSVAQDLEAGQEEAASVADWVNRITDFNRFLEVTDFLRAYRVRNLEALLSRMSPPFDGVPNEVQYTSGVSKSLMSLYQHVLYFGDRGLQADGGYRLQIMEHPVEATEFLLGVRQQPGPSDLRENANTVTDVSSVGSEVKLLADAN